MIKNLLIYLFLYSYINLDIMNACQKEKSDVALVIYFTKGGDLTAQK